MNLQQIKLIILAGSLGFVGGSTAFLPTFGILILPLGVIFVALYPTIIGYAIIRYRLMDIRLVILRTVTFAFLLFVITSLFAVISSIIGEFFVEQVGFKSNLVVGLIVGLLVTTAYNPVRKLLERATNQYLYKQSYDPDELLTEISNTASSILDLQKLLTAISDLLDTAMQPSRIGIALVNKRGLLQIYFERGFKEGEAKTLARGNEEVMWKHFKREPGVAVIDELITRYEAGDYQPISKLVLYALKEHDIGAVVPLYVQDKLIGIMALGNKKSGDVYNQQDIGLLGIINGQVAVAVDNARLYEELKVFNITLQQKVDEATADLRGANRQLKLMDQTKSEFISIASHQLRTPLTISKGYISMMLEGSFGKVPGKIRETLDKVYQANERLITLVENLLDISRIESGRQEFTWDTFDFVELAKSVTDEHELPAKRKKVKLLFHGPKKELMVYGDKNKLHEMMFNFIDNSIKYTDKGKTEVFVTEEGDNLRFAVKDTGRGVTEDTIAHLFKKFSRGKDSFKVHTEGTGLGLYVVRMIAEAHHGNVGVESAGRDTGSTFFFIIPKNGPKAEGYKPQEPIRKYTGVHTEESDEKEEEETQSETEPQETEE